jgi:elongation factor G
MADDIHTQPPWLVEIAIEPKSKADREMLDIALAKLAAEDPSFRVIDRPGVRPDHSQGHGRTPSRHQDRHPQAHLQVDANIGPPQVAFRERMTQRVEVEYTHKKSLGR